MNRVLRNTGWGMCLLIGSYSAQSFTEAMPGGPGGPMLHNLPVPLALAVLEGQRGGFFTAEGLNVRIGFERVTLIDGEVVARSTLTIPDISTRMQSMEQSMQSMQADMQVAQDKMQESMDTSMAMMKEVMEQPQLQQHPDLNDQSRQTLSQMSDTLDMANTIPSRADVAVAKPGGSGFDLQQESNAQTGIRTDTATLSLVNGKQVQSSLPVSGAAKSVAFENPMTIARPLTNIAQTATSTLIQNASYNRLIQTFQVLNVQLSDVGPKGIPRLHGQLQQLMVDYRR